jgi:diguanylate cyclase (GGDEF)-like protein
VRILWRLAREIPPFMWIVLAVSVVLALLSGVATLCAARRARARTLAFAAASEAALTDPLTGVLNRRGFIDAAERELARAERYGRPFALAYVDVRGLKRVNDAHGHRAGDALLRHVASMLTASARANDNVGRLGGDELGLLLAEATLEGAAAMAARIRAQVPERRADIGIAAPWDLTIGIAVYPEDGSDLDQLLQTADRRLYEQRGITLR